MRLAVILSAAATLAAVFAGGASSAGFAAAIPSGRALAQLAGGSEPVLVAVGPDARATKILRRAGGTLAIPQLHVWKVPASAATRVVPALAGRHLLRYAEPDRRLAAVGHFTDPLTTPDLGWQLYAIGADQVDSPGAGFPITILDSGIDLNHPDFAGRPNLTTLNEQVVGGPDGDDYHGTIVASTAAAARNGVGAEGVYPDASLRIYDLGDLSDLAIARAVLASVNAGPSVINMSFGGFGSRTLNDSILLAVHSGSLVVAAAGNELDHGNPVEFPAQYPHVFTAGSIGRDGAPSSFSSSGPGVDLAAPGDEIAFQHPTDPKLYGLASGTSFAAPIVSAAAAWVQTARPDLSIGQVADVLRTSATDIDAPGFDDRTGFGLLDLPAALVAATPPADTPEPNDDIDEIAAHRLFSTAQPAISTPHAANTRFAATLDLAEDPDDVYRVVLPARKKLTVVVTPSANVSLDLWSSAAGSVAGIAGRLARSNRPGSAGERVVFVNRNKKLARTLYVQVRTTERRVTYVLSVRTAAAPR